MSQTHKKHTQGFIEDQREFFDHLITDDWDTYNSAEWDRSRQVEIDHTFQIVGDQIKNVLDVGCGCGYQDKEMAKRKNIESVVGIDYSAKSIEQAEKYYPDKKVKRQVVDILDPKSISPFEKKFDLVVSFQVLEHLKSGQDFFKFNKFAVRDGGYVAIITPNWKRLENRIRAGLGLKYGFCDPLHFQEYAIDDLIEMGKKNDLSFAGAFGHTFQMSLKGIQFLNLSSSFSYARSPRLTNLTNVIGVVFQS